MMIKLVIMCVLIELINCNKIIQLNEIYLNEEEFYDNKILYKFNEQKVELVSNSLLPQFYINQSQLLVNGSFDREALVQNGQCESVDCVLNLKIASYNDKNALLSLFNLPLRVQDTNDHRPEFNNMIQLLNISENSPIGTQIKLELPVDLDSSLYSVQNCYLENLNFSKNFYLNYLNESQNLYLIVNTSIDRETRANYELRLSCTDGFYISTCLLSLSILDVNDNKPILLSPRLDNVSLNENQFYKNFYQVKALDLDDSDTPNGRLVYKLSPELNSNEVLEYFSINETSGYISLKTTLDYEKSKKFILKIKIQDQGANSVPIFCDLLVTVLDQNDNAPKAHLTFSDKHIKKENRTNNTVWINEELYQDKPIILGYMTLTDLDSPLVNNFTLKADLETVSYLNTSSNLVELEVEPSFRLVQIVQEYQNIYFSLQLIKQVDREQKSYFDLKIRLSDSINTDHVLIRVILIDINDNKPIFKYGNFYKYYIKENHLSFNFASLEFTDKDQGVNAELNFKILEENNLDLVKNLFGVYNDSLNPNFLFYIDPDNGSLSLRGELDREQKDFYLLTVRCSDKPLDYEQTKYTDVLIQINLLDQNDNQPVYNYDRVEFKLDENLPVGTLVGNLKANDADLDAKTEYIIEPSRYMEYFEIDPETGDLITRVKLDAEQDPAEFNFKVIAKDAELESNAPVSSVNVTILLNDINDNSAELVDNKQDYLIESIDLNSQVNECGLNKIIKILEFKDKDRDLLNRNKNLVKFNFIRRLSWQFVNEIVKTSNQNETNNNMEKFLSLILSNQMSFKSFQKVNLRSVFSLGMVNNDSNKFNLNVSQLCKLNWGVYNLSVQLYDNLSLSLKTDFSVKVLVYNSLNQSQVSLGKKDTQNLVDLIENWWSSNYNLISAYKKKILNGSKDDNGDDMDSMSQEYYKFASGSLFSMSSILLLSKTQNSVVFLISLFALVSVVLVLVILYKQLSLNRKNYVKNKSKNSKKLLNIKKEDYQSSSSSQSTGSSLNISELITDTNSKKSLDKQSTKDLSSSPKLINSKLALRADNTQLISSTGLNQEQSACDSFTVITKNTGSESSSTNPVSIEQGFLSTFGSNKNDLGYYGSSDYSSENNSFNNKQSSKIIQQKLINNQTNSSASFTSSSILSSPASSKSDHNSDCVQKQPIITNLYPITSKQSDVKLYLEKFERIYNSDNLNSTLNNSHSNRITTYSYV